MKKILISVMTLVLVLGLVGAGAFAWFSDTETVGVHDISAGTLDLKLDDKDAVVHVELHNIAPGWNEKYDWTLKNTGSITGVVTVKFDNIIEIENDPMNDPELVAEATTFPGGECTGQTVGLSTGELGYLMSAKPSRAELYPSVEKSPGLPCPSYMPNGGGLHYLCTRDAFLLGRNYEEAKLGPGETCIFRLRLGLADDLKSWDGCHKIQIDDNVIQSDSVEFDIILHLDQVNPYVDETT